MYRSNRLLWLIVSAAALAVAGCGGGGNDVTPAGSPPAAVAAYVVPKATCGSGDHPETALQGQVPASMRNGFGGFNCNLEIVGQYQGEGADWSAAMFKDASGHICAYHAMAAPTDSDGKSRGIKKPGVPVIDITDPAKPVYITSLTSPAMLDPWESLRVSMKRGLLVADNGSNGGGGAQVDVYDIASDCRHPQLLASIDVGTGSDGGVVAPKAPSGHEGGLSPDGLTYYVGSLPSNAYYAIDISVPQHPKNIASVDLATLPLGGLAHGLSVSDDGKRAYFASIGADAIGLASLPPPLNDPNAKVQNGFYVMDTSQVQARAPNAKMTLIASIPVRDGSTSQHTIPIRVKGKPYLVHVDEGGSGGLLDPATKNAAAACAAGLSPFPMAHIYDMSNEASPVQISETRLETHVTANCSRVLPDMVGVNIFGYGSHYCTVDNRENATAMACGFQDSGVRVFDIRDPAAPKEIAYLNPPGTTVSVPGSQHTYRGWHAGNPDWCNARLDFDFENHRLVTACQDNGQLVMAFKNGVWPMPESTPAADASN
jgi:hypothetical protein